MHEGPASNGRRRSYVPCEAPRVRRMAHTIAAALNHLFMDVLHWN